MRTFQTFIRVNDLRREVIESKACLGESNSHPRYHPYSEIYRGGFEIIDTQLPSLQCDRAYQFLKLLALSKKKETICFVGEPPQKKLSWIRLLRRHGYLYLSSDNWSPGLLSRREGARGVDATSLKGVEVVVIFDLKKHKGAKEEAKRAQKVVIGFGSSPKELEGVDYPVPFSLFTSRGGRFYLSFLRSALSTKEFIGKRDR